MMVAAASFLLAVAAAATPASEASPQIPESPPWLSLARDSGLAGGDDDGLVFAVWPDGMIVRRARTGGDASFDLSSLSADQLRDLSRAIEASGLLGRQSARRFLDLPESGLVIRGATRTGCWYDTPGLEMTPGLANVARHVSHIRLKKATRVRLTQDQWLPWSHYWEDACAS